MYVVGVLPFAAATMRLAVDPVLAEVGVKLAVTPEFAGLTAAASMTGLVGGVLPVMLFTLVVKSAVAPGAIVCD